MKIQPTTPQPVTKPQDKKSVATEQEFKHLAVKARKGWWG